MRAAQLWKEGYAPLVLPSGKYSKLTGYFTGHGNYETEWDYFHEILLKEGGPGHAILQEKHGHGRPMSVVSSNGSSAWCKAS